MTIIKIIIGITSITFIGVSITSNTVIRTNLNFYILYYTLKFLKNEFNYTKTIIILNYQSKLNIQKNSTKSQ